MRQQDRQLLNQAVAALRRTTGIATKVTSRTAQGPGPDVVLEFEEGNRPYRFVPEVKAVDRFETPALVKAHRVNERTPPLLVAPYITHRTAERCRELDLPFIDTAGNAYLRGPGVFVYVTGEDRPAEFKQQRFRALNPAGLQVTFAMLCQPRLIDANYREIAIAANVALGTVGPVIKDLETRGLLRFRNHGTRRLVDPRRLLEEWVTHYPTTLRPKLNARRFEANAERLVQTELEQYRAYWGGEMAAQKLTSFLKPAFFTIYAREPIVKLLAANRLRAAQNGNVEILDVFWEFDADPDWPDMVPPVLTYADLLATNDGRNAEAARLIYEQRIEPPLQRAGYAG